MLSRPVDTLLRLLRWTLRAPERGVSRWIVILLLVFYGLIGWMLPKGDSLVFTPAEAASVRHRYGLVAFEFGNFMDKWFHRVYTAFPWTDTDTEDRQEHLAQYMELVPEIRDAQYQVLRQSSGQTVDSATLGASQERLDELLSERNRIRDSVEEYLEAAISAELMDLGLNPFGEFIWPPVDFRIDNPPSVLVVSPRDRIVRSETVLIDPDIPVAEMERIERSLTEDYNLSAVVLRTGGLASYPNVIPSDRDLHPLLEVAAHEWIHAYLIFHPLGRSFFSGGSMVEINETLANLVGDEIGGNVWADLTGNEPPVREAPAVVGTDDDQPEPETDPDQFDFFSFMRETRLRTDDLLEQGKIDEAENWMEERRLLLQENGYLYRKINQAFFAFNGSYGDSASSTSPTARQLWELRQQEQDPGDVLKALRGISTYAEFEALLRERGILSGE